VWSTYFEILSHIEEIVINDRDVLKFVICVGMAIVIIFPGATNIATSLPVPLHFIYHKSRVDYPGISDIRRVAKNKDIGYITWYFVSLKVGHSVEDT
jgi:hypothetical protein